MEALLRDDRNRTSSGKAYSMLWLITRNFQHIGPAAFVLIYKHLVRSHLEYNNSVWAPYRKLDIDKLEKVQKRATKMIQVNGLSDLMFFIKMWT